MVAAGQFILQMSLLAKGIEYAAVALIVDDTYYYLQTAWNAKHHLFHRAVGQNQSRSFIYNLSCELFSKYALLLNHLKNRVSFETTGSGVVHGQLMGAAKPSF
jgi:hypothetical protein